MKTSEKSLFAQDLKNRLTVISLILQKQLTINEAACRLQLSISYTYRLASQMRKTGHIPLAYRKNRCGRHPIFSQEKKQQIVTLFDEYISLCKNRHINECSIYHFKKELEKRKRINISYTKLYTLLKNAGKKSQYAHKRRDYSAVHPYRARKKYEGELWLADGSPHNWLGGLEKQTIHIVQDDATGDLVGLYMTRNECFNGYAEAFKRGLQRYGVPENLITDRASVFFVSKKQQDTLSIEDQLKGVTDQQTQMGTIIGEKLGIAMKPAFTPEQKGRVERVGQTLQHRLPIIFMLEQINDIESANRYLAAYVDEYNEEFSVKPKEEESRYVTVPKNIDLTKLFSIKKSRKTDKAGTFSFHNYHFKIKAPTIDCRNRKVTLYLNEKWGIKAELNHKLYDVELMQLEKNKKACGQQGINLPKVWNDLFEKYLFFDAKTPAIYHIAAS